MQQRRAAGFFRRVAQVLFLFVFRLMFSVRDLTAVYIHTGDPPQAYPIPMYPSLSIEAWAAKTARRCHPREATATKAVADRCGRATPATCVTTPCIQSLEARCSHGEAFQVRCRRHRLARHVTVLSANAPSVCFTFQGYRRVTTSDTKPYSVVFEAVG